MKLQVKKLFLVLAMSSVVGESYADTLTLEQCRTMALANNKAMQIARERVNSADYQKQEARAAYLPGFDLTMSYLHNQKQISLLESDQYLPTKSFNPASGEYEFNLVTGPDGNPATTPDGGVIPSQVAMIPKSAMTYDVRNVFAGAVTLTQPLYMGGKIRALNKMSGYAKDLAESQVSNEAKEVVYMVDEAYWQVVSLAAKKRLADSYIALLDTLNRNVKALMSQGLATKSDLLTVEVKQNEAQIDLTRVVNGMELSRMALAQICGLPLDSKPEVADEYGTLEAAKVGDTSFDMSDVYNNRNDIRSLELAVKIYEQKQNVVRADMLPSVALVGAYSMTNPNVFNGFDKSLKGMFSVGAMVKVPLWHWGSNYNKLRQARSEAFVKRLELDEAKEKVELQVNQAAYRAVEAQKVLKATTSNLVKADENLRQAQLGYGEGVMTLDNVMTAQTAWLKANSENIDAQIDVRLCDVYLQKVKGNLSNE